MSKAFTVEEVRDEFLKNVRQIAKFWADLPNKTPQERCDGVAFSILNIFDGTTVDLPAMDLSLAPHVNDKAYCEERNKNWYEHGMVINNCHLHNFYYYE